MLRTAPVLLFAGALGSSFPLLAQDQDPGVMIGASSEDIRLRTRFELSADVIGTAPAAALETIVSVK